MTHTRVIFNSLLSFAFTLMLLSCVQKITAGPEQTGKPAEKSTGPQKNAGKPLNMPEDSTASLENELHTLVNNHRKSKGLSPLKTQEAATLEARQHSRDMALGKSGFSHDGFEERLNAIEKRQGKKSREAAENLGTGGPGRPDANALLAAWLKSPGHRKNIEGNFTHTGTGVAKNDKGTWYITQIFLKQ